MTPERWRQVEGIFQTALDLPVERRATYLSDACGADSTLHEEVVSRLASHETGDYSFEDLVPEEIKAKRFDPFGEDVDPLIGKRLGAYEIVREIGRGGMGAVYEAVRVDKEFTRRVAIKLVKRGKETAIKDLSGWRRLSRSTPLASLSSASIRILRTCVLIHDSET